VIPGSKFAIASDIESNVYIRPYRMAKREFRELARDCSAYLHLRDFLLYFDHAAAAPAKKMAGHAWTVEDRRQSYNQRRHSRNNCRPKRGLSTFASSAR